MKTFIIALALLNLSTNYARAQGDVAPAGAPPAGDQIVHKKPHHGDKKGESCPHCKEEGGKKNHKKHHHNKHPHDQHDAAEGTAQ